MAKLAERALIVAVVCLIAALGCCVGAAWHRPSAGIAHALIAIAGVATAIMIWALARMEKEMRRG